MRHIGNLRWISLTFSLLPIFLISGHGVCQSLTAACDSAFRARKTIKAVRINTPPKIDGIMDEPFWKDIPAARDFVEYSPRNGSVPPFSTEIRIAYDDHALYAAAIMYDPSPDSISRELGKRDQVEQLTTDYISLDILPYNDGLNMYEFKVTPAGLQNDCKYSAIGQDLSWDAVWQCAAKITSFGWVAEVAIPYSALRFPKLEEQVWGINFWRSLHRRNEFSTWSYIDNNVQDIFKYYGELVGIKDIKPPLRLSFTPYLSGYLEQVPGSKKLSCIGRGGLDLRYGINESYTLDMMLIPDFGQVASDDQVLNLSPFEIKYDEKRQFFTEATEMFNKCNLFYTRRVGSIHNTFGRCDTLGQHEIISEDPQETRIINATKISGRNSNGLGLGFFNAMTSNTYSHITDTVSGSCRKILTQPYANYNVLVLDQNLKYHSYITLINTNFWTPADAYSDNVTGLETYLNNKKRTYAILGRFCLSQKFIKDTSPDRGYSYLVSFYKTSGKFQYQLVRQEINPHYDPNDMGFLTKNNETVNQVKLGYYIMEPFWKMLTTRTEFLCAYATRTRPYTFETIKLMAANSTSFKNLWSLYLDGIIYPFGMNDFYEARTPGFVYKVPLFYCFDFYLASNSRKKFQVQTSLYCQNSPSSKNLDYFCELVPRFRFSDRFNVTLDIYYEKNLNSYGWVENQTDNENNAVPCFGRRDITTISNVLATRYIFSTKTSVTFRVRHYWSTARYLAYYSLNPEGRLDPFAKWMDHDINYNAFNVDMQFTWYFAPGSEIDLVWKNAINTQNNLVANNYWEDFRSTINSAQSNSISIRILYYLDFLSFRKNLLNRKTLQNEGMT